MAHDVFISYSSKDKTIADAVCAALEAAKIRCWIAPRDILPGEKWAASITKAIASSRLMVLVFSSNSTNSEDVLNELLLAKDNRVIIIPFKIGDILPSGEMGYYLSRTHWLDAMNPPTEQEIQKLVEIANRFMTGEVFWRKEKNDTAIIDSEKEIDNSIPIPTSVVIKPDDLRAISKEEEHPAKQHEVMQKAKESEDLAAEKKDKIISQKTIIIAAIVLGSLLLGYWVNTQNPINAPETVNTTPQPTPMSIPAVSPIATIQPGTFTNSIGMDFVTMPKGEFDMGSPSNEIGRDRREGPVHRVNISKSFYMGKYEVTQKQWQEVMGNNPSQLKGDDLPVEQVSWNDVQEFINKLNEKEGVNKYRLPSEAEWEYAIRAGTNTKYFFGDNISDLGDYAWYSEKPGRTHPVGQKKPNPWGLYDMRGNVFEWMQDIYHDNYNGAPSNGSAWEGMGSNRVIRGGGGCIIYIDKDEHCRSASREFEAQGVGNYVKGFRLVMEINTDIKQT